MIPEEWKTGGQYYLHQGIHQIFYKIEGSGPVLVLLHGFPTASWDWHKIWPKLIQHYQVIALDFIGFGFSDKPFRYAYSIFDQTDIVENLLVSLNIENYHVLAHDYGDTVAQELLARGLEKRSHVGPKLLSLCFLNGGIFSDAHQPRPIQKALISPFGILLTPILSQRTLAKNFKAIFGPQTQATAKEIEHFFALIKRRRGKYIFHKLIRYMRERQEHKIRWEEALSLTKIPLRLIDGAFDPISGAHLAKRYQKEVPDADVVLLEQIGHYPQTEAPEEVLKHFFSFGKRYH